jgi:hypothetical protein
MKKIKVWFASFWGRFDIYDNLFTYTLSQRYNIEITPDNPDIVISNHFIERYQNAKMVYFSGEPFYELGVNDYALTSFYIDDSKFFRVPLYLLYAYDYYKSGFTNSYGAILKKSNLLDFLFGKTEFCNYIARGPGGTPRRTEFFQKLSQYKKVDALGQHFNNGPIVPGESGSIEGSIEKCKVQSNYKFSIAFENSSEYNGKIGYTTEKIFEPMIAMSIPIYWGNPKIEYDFNPNSFINWNDYGSDEKVIERIIEIDNDKDLYSDYVTANYVNNTKLFDIDYLVNIFDKIIGD